MGLSIKNCKKSSQLKTEVIINTLVREIFPFMDQAEL